MIALSRRQIKTMDRVGGATLILDWPPDLPLRSPIPPDHERRATAEEDAVARSLVRPACEAAGLVPVRVLVVHVRRPHDYPRGGTYEHHLAVTITGHRWVHATGTHHPPDMWAMVQTDAR